MWLTIDLPDEGRLPRRSTQPVPKRAPAPGPPDLVEFARTRLQFFPDEAQERVLRSEAKRGLLNCTRQWGKSTVCAAKAVHRAYTRPRSLVMIATPGERQSGEFLNKAAAMAGQLGIKPRGDGFNSISLLFPNGSRIIGLPGNEATVRGFSAVSLLIIDEASRVEEAMYAALRPMLATNEGDLWMMSTPNGKSGFFYNAWAHDGDLWERFMVPATECPRISKAFLEEERGQLGAEFAQEYLCEFVDTGMSPFGRDLVEAALDGSIQSLDIDRLVSTWDRQGW